MELPTDCWNLVKEFVMYNPEEYYLHKCFREHLGVAGLHILVEILNDLEINTVNIYSLKNKYLTISLSVKSFSKNTKYSLDYRRQTLIKLIFNPYMLLRSKKPEMILSEKLLSDYMTVSSIYFNKLLGNQLDWIYNVSVGDIIWTKVYNPVADMVISGKAIVEVIGAIAVYGSSFNFISVIDDETQILTITWTTPSRKQDIKLTSLVRTIVLSEEDYNIQEFNQTILHPI